MAAACQSNEADDLLLQNKSIISNGNIETAVKQITNDVNTAEIDNILRSLFWEKTKGRSKDYTISILKDALGKDRIICINYENNGGFALISAEKTFSPILAYSDEGHFDVSSDHPYPLCKWIDFMMESIAESETMPYNSLTSIKNMWRKYEYAHAPLAYDYPQNNSRLVNLTWDEYYALSQIMMTKINEWNAAGYRVYAIDDWTGTCSIGDSNAVGTYVKSRINPYYMDDYRDLTIVVEKDFDHSSGKGHCLKTEWSQRNGYNQCFPKSHYYTDGLYPVGCGPLAVGQILFYHKYPKNINWDDMTLSGYGNNVTSDFLYKVANNCEAIYNENGTGTSYQNLAYALRNTYGYTCKSSQNVNKNELIGKTPAILSGSMQNNNGEIGHTWILEGEYLGTHHSELEIWSFDYSNEFVCFHNETSNEISLELYYINWCLTNTDSNGYYRYISQVPDKEDFISSKIENVIYDIKPKQ
ncbi:MAG: C10 family peptidase [Muribaculaceae bacterium]|nr:C10 family peptidase [Muribaculaceae bacterium]